MGFFAYWWKKWPQNFLTDIFTTRTNRQASLWPWTIFATRWQRSSGLRLHFRNTTRESQIVISKTWIYLSNDERQRYYHRGYWYRRWQRGRPWPRSMACLQTWKWQFYCVARFRKWTRSGIHGQWLFFWTGKKATFGDSCLQTSLVDENCTRPCLTREGSSCFRLNFDVFPTLFAGIFSESGHSTRFGGETLTTMCSHIPMYAFRRDDFMRRRMLQCMD